MTKAAFPLSCAIKKCGFPIMGRVFRVSFEDQIRSESSCKIFALQKCKALKKQFFKIRFGSLQEEADISRNPGAAGEDHH